MIEPEIVINGMLLNSAQASSVRVAVASMLTDLADPEHMASLGEIGPLYRARLSEVQRIMLGVKP